MKFLPIKKGFHVAQKKKSSTAFSYYFRDIKKAPELLQVLDLISEFWWEIQVSNL
jgi:hypothetical protein